jgi:copper chaperone CopZ
MTAVRYRVSGVTCGQCVHAVAGGLANLGGVSGVRVGLSPGGESAVTASSAAPLAAEAAAAVPGEAGG